MASDLHAKHARTTPHRKTCAHLRNELNRFHVERPRNPLLFTALQTLPVVMRGLVILSSPGMQLRLLCHIMMRLQASQSSLAS